jgi:hypothetical protein
MTLETYKLKYIHHSVFQVLRNNLLVSIVHNFVLSDSEYYLDSYCIISIHNKLLNSIFPFLTNKNNSNTISKFRHVSTNSMYY